MKQNIVAKSGESSGTGRAARAAGTQQTRQPRHQGYLSLATWPTLAAPVAVHLDMATGQAALRVPIKLMRKCGMYPERGVNVATFQDRVLIRGNECGGVYRQLADSKQLMLGTTGISPAVATSNFAIVEGPDYLVLTTRAEALAMAAGATVVERRAHQRVDNVPVPHLDAELDPAGVEVLGWKDTNTINCVRGRKSRVASVSGHLWWLAGFQCGDALRFTRYLNATVVEKCAPGEQHSTLNNARPRAGANGIPRHFFGAALLNTRGVDQVRVIAAPGKLIVTQPQTDIGALCTEATFQANPPRPLAPPPEPLAPLPMLDVDSVAVLRSKKYAVRNNRLTITGDIWTKAGFTPQHPAKLVRYANAVAVEACDEAAMGFRIGTPSQRRPYRNLGLAGSVLADARQVQVVAAEGRLILAQSHVVFGAALVKPVQAPAPVALTSFDRAGLVVLKSKLCTLQSGQVRLSGLMCAPAEFAVHQPVRVVRHADAVVVEACDEANMDFRVKRKNGLPYLPLNLENTVLAAELRVRVHAAKGRIVLAKPKCGPLDAYTAREAHSSAVQAAQSAGLGVLKARHCLVKAGRIAVRGQLMVAAGLSANDPVRVLRYPDALVMEACAEADMNFRLKKENGGLPVASVVLAGTVLANEHRVLALAGKGRIVLAALESDALAERLASAAAEPDTAEVAVPAPEPAPGTEVCRYQVPAGKRLQMQGRWLGEYGFKAGAKYGVRIADGKVYVELGGDATWTVTTYTATTSKLYVPAKSLESLGAAQVQVLAREGLLELVPIA